MYNFVEFTMAHKIRFWLLLSFDIPAAISTFVLLGHLLLKPAFRKELHNHVILALLLIAFTAQLIDIPFYIVTMQLNHVGLSIPFFSDLWTLINVGLLDMTAVLMAWLAIERYIYVFHQQLFNSRRRRILFHFIPLFFVIFYESIFYIVVIFFPSCEKIYDYTQPWCGYPCYYNDTIVSTFDTIGNCISVQLF